MNVMLRRNGAYQQISLGGMLLGTEIERAYHESRLLIDPFDPACVGPNSYDIHVGNKVLEYEIHGFIDPTDGATYRTKVTEIPEQGIILYPGRLYLVPTKEKIGSNHYIPMLTGRSSIGRLGISVHQEGGLGDVGYLGNWILQITTMYPFLLKPFSRLAQVYFMVPHGELDETKLYKGKYYNTSSDDLKGSLLYLDPDV